jgi:membrane-bound lytic murein transglycosylase D
MSSGISIETRALLESQIKALKSYYPIRTAEKLSTSPLNHFPLTDNEIVGMIDGLGEKWPVYNMETVIQYVRFFAYTHSDDTRYLLAMAELQQQLSAEAFHEYDIPDELMYLALVKSGMNPKYVSSSGAQGTWQFMYSTARLYHLRIDNYVDERREIHKSSEAAAWMLKDLYNMYHDWPLAITAFSCGPGNVNKALKNADTIPDLSTAYEFLPSPERDLYTMFIAIQVVINNPVRFGLEPASINAELINDTVQIDEKLHLGQVADVMGIDKELLVKGNQKQGLEVKQLIHLTQLYRQELIIPLL